MTWYAVIDRRSGALFSGTDDEKALAGAEGQGSMPAHLEVVALADPPQDGQAWDAVAREFIPMKTDREVFLEELTREDAALVDAKRETLDRAWAAFEQRITSGR